MADSPTHYKSQNSKLITASFYPHPLSPFHFISFIPELSNSANTHVIFPCVILSISTLFTTHPTLPNLTSLFPSNPDTFPVKARSKKTQITRLYARSCKSLYPLRSPIQIHFGNRIPPLPDYHYPLRSNLRMTELSFRLDGAAKRAFYTSLAQNTLV